MFKKMTRLTMTALIIVWVAGCNQATNSNAVQSANAQANARPSPSSDANSTPSPAATTVASNEPISITTPANDAKVEYREIVRGKVADPKAKVWVIMRPMSVSEYWVQPPVDVDQDGKWSVTVFFGQSASANANERFKVTAIANPVKALKEGDKLTGWPDAKWKSQTIEVIRK